MKKNSVFNKRDLYNILIFTFVFIGLILIISKFKYIWGSELDWIDQHSIIPEYFRTLFYDTHNLFPNLALNLGSGQNIYNFAYYGLFNPVIMISYLLPFVEMKYYIVVSTLILVYSSIILFYYFLRSNKFNEKVSFLSTIIFMCASPLLFHSHRHIMFINYMPFLILSLIGVDNYFKNRKVLLPVSILLIILMSFYYSISAIICITVYWIYKYIINNDKFKFKSFIKEGLLYIIIVLIGILMSSILIVPEFYAIISGRIKTLTEIPLSSLIIPKINISYILYYYYGVGLTSISIISLVSMFFSKRKENIFLTIILSLLIVFPIFNYILNGFMYLDAKILIPFLPLYVLVVAKFIKNFFEGKIEINKTFIITIFIIAISLIMNTYKSEYFIYESVITVIMMSVCYRKKLFKVFGLYIIVVSIVLSVLINSVDKMVLKNNILYENDINQKELVDYITNNDRGIYRITSLIDEKHTSNTIFSNIDMYQDTLYSSIYNELYNKFYYDVFNNQIQSRNRILTTSSANPLFLMFMGNKYVLSQNGKIVGYDLYKTENNINAYYNEDVLPFMYISYNEFNEETFSKVSFPYSNELLLNYAVTKNSKNVKYKSSIHKFSVSKIEYENINVIKNNKEYSFNATEKSKIYIELPNYVKDIAFVKFKMNKLQHCSKGDQAIIINGEINKLTCKEWKYNNENTTFTYTLSINDTKSFEIEFFKGNYSISDIELYYLDYNNIDNIRDKVTEVNINKEKTKGDNIYGIFNALSDGYFVTTIPYQKGFSIMLDNKRVEYENINSGFIGFKVSKGKHDVVFSYKAPLRTIGEILSIIGIVSYVVLLIKNRNH